MIKEEKNTWKTNSFGNIYCTSLIVDQKIVCHENDTFKLSWLNFCLVKAFGNVGEFPDG